MFIVALTIVTILTALLAGIFLAYSVSVNGALAKLKDAEYVRVMQAINFVIERNALFMMTFMLPVLGMPLVTVLAYWSASSIVFWLLLVASVLYVFGTFGLTVGGNVPRNNRLAKLNLETSSAEEIASERRYYEEPWNSMHNARTALAVVATVLLVIAITLV